MKALCCALLLLMMGTATAFQTAPVSLRGVVLEMGSNNAVANATLELRVAGESAPRSLAVSSTKETSINNG